ncbi:MAG: hypothetical protein VX498_12155 [Myxococcota bacterium]|nr:hypothetical protein [Myxococcota bacterium]
MDSFALLFAAVAAGLTAAVAASKANRSLWSEVRVRDRLIYVLLVVATVVVSLFHFDSVNNHAWRPHEESLWFAMRANIPHEGWHPLEVQVLVRQIYRGVGLVLGAHPEASWDELKYAFVATAFALGGWGAVLAGLGWLRSRRPPGALPHPRLLASQRLPRGTLSRGLLLDAPRRRRRCPPALSTELHHLVCSWCPLPVLPF